MPDPNHYSAIGWIIVGLAALCVAANQVDDYFKRRSGQDRERVISPQPFEIKATAEFVHRKDFDAHVETDQAAHKDIFSKLGGMERGLRADLRTEANDLHERITETATKTAALEEAKTITNQRLQSIDGKLDTLLSRVGNHHSS